LYNYGVSKFKGGSYIWAEEDAAEAEVTASAAAAAEVSALIQAAAVQGEATAVSAAEVQTSIRVIIPVVLCFTEDPSFSEVLFIISREIIFTTVLL